MGIVSQYAYDNAGRLTGITYPAGPSANVAFTYDDTTDDNKGIGRLTGMDDSSGESAFAYDLRDEIVQVQSTITGKTYAVDSAEAEHPSTGRTVTYVYDASGRPTRVMTQALYTDAMNARRSPNPVSRRS